ncbi:MAG: polyphosphate kinase 2 [Acidimicrobiales bacterium]|nr:polyphosphate kinase 2 [Acidimicrobiales bacterium]
MAHDKRAQAVETASRVPRKTYEDELTRLQAEAVKMMYWVRHTGQKLVLVFEGRDAAGKGGMIKRLTDPLSPRIARIVALPAPSERETTQWYFQRYVAHLPAAGEIVVFDRSWYNRAGVEKVMGFCTPQEHRLFLRQCPIFERLVVESGILLLKYWFSVSDEEQERRFQERVEDPSKRWKLSPMDLYARSRYVDYSRARDEMFVHTDIPEAPWFVVEADDKRRARLNCLAHILEQVPYEDHVPARLDLPARQSDEGYVRPPREASTYVPDHVAGLLGEEHRHRGG